VLRKISLKFLMSLGLSVFLLFPLQFILLKKGIVELSSPARYIFFIQINILNFIVLFFAFLVFPILEKLLTATFQFKKWTLILEVAAVFFCLFRACIYFKLSFFDGLSSSCLCFTSFRLFSCKMGLALFFVRWNFRLFS